MCSLEAVYFSKEGNTIPGLSCSGQQTDSISVEVVAGFDAGDTGRYAAVATVRRPDGNEVQISSLYKNVSGTETFVFGNWAKPIPPGTYTITDSWIENEAGETACAGISSGGFCQRITIGSVPPPSCNFEVV